MIRALLLSALALATTAGLAGAQSRPPDRSAEVRAALERLPVSPGVWEGTGWFRQGPGDPDTVHQVERVEARLDGVVLLIEGTGRSAFGEVVHHAFATLGWDPAAGAYRMTTWLADGTMTEAETTFADGVFTWGFDVPDGPMIRYRIESPEPGVWRETGHVSLDGGGAWLPFFGMTLHRTPTEEG